MEEHINSTESHYLEDCPGETCVVATGLRRVLDGLRDGTFNIRRVQ